MLASDRNIFCTFPHLTISYLLLCFKMSFKLDLCQISEDPQLALQYVVVCIIQLNLQDGSHTSIILYVHSTRFSIGIPLIIALAQPTLRILTIRHFVLLQPLAEGWRDGYRPQLPGMGLCLAPPGTGTLRDCSFKQTLVFHCL